MFSSTQPRSVAVDSPGGPHGGTGAATRLRRAKASDAPRAPERWHTSSACLGAPEGREMGLPADCAISLASIGNTNACPGAPCSMWLPVNDAHTILGVEC